MGGLFDTYVPAPGWDEMFSSSEGARDHYEPLHETLGSLTAGEYASRCDARDRSFRDQGITFQLSGEVRPFPLDLVPRVIPADEWDVIEAGVRQRVRGLEAFLADVYSVGRILDDGMVPRRLVVTSSHFHRPAAGVEPPNGARVQVAGIDIVRGDDGVYRVLEDNLRVPSGISYVIENRRVMTQVFPELFASQRVRPVEEYPQRLLNALRAAAPAGRTDPTVVVLTPGVYNSAYFEHSFLARQMGVALVEGRDLMARDGVVYMRTTSGEERVDVIYRRVDDDFLDPVHFRPDSLVGCPGVLNAARDGNVAIANAIGNGVADDKAIYPYVPKIIRYYLDEEPILPNVLTYDLEDEHQRTSVLDRLHELVVKPVDGSGGYGLVIGPQATLEELESTARAIADDPRQWIAQEVVTLSSLPAHVEGEFAARHVDLRPFAVNDGNDVWVVPGGLTRVALREGSLIVNSSQGGGSKDTWVLAAPNVEEPADGEEPVAGEEDRHIDWLPQAAGPAPAPHHRQQEQQQQQQQRTEAPTC